MQKVSKLIRKLDFIHVDAHRIKFKPFPGRYPTRWVIVLTNKKDETIFSYFGKPSESIAIKVNKLISITKGGRALTAEVDKLGAFRLANRSMPRDEMTVQYTSPVVVTRYYPWGVGNGDFFRNWYSPVYLKLLKLGKKSIFVYSPYDSLLSDERRIDLCRTFRRWLQTNLANVAKLK